MEADGSERLAGIRRRIDAIDAEMHRLLIARGAVIDELIRVKGTAASGAAFRPGREADMMRRLTARHEGRLPLATVEHIWREIITTFTAMQAPFGVSVAPAADPLAMRDLVRFYFGFSVPIADCASAAEALERVRAAPGELAVVPIEGGSLWWHDLGKRPGAHIIARLPAIAMEGRPAALPAYVVGPPLDDDAELDLAVYVLEATGDVHEAVAAHGGRVVAAGPEACLVELPLAADIGALAADLAERGGALLATDRIGAIAAPIEVVAAEGPALAEAGANR
jgi:chorismate mutase / prephenate dehydratase